MKFPLLVFRAGDFFVIPADVGYGRCGGSLFFLGNTNYATMLGECDDYFTDGVYFLNDLLIENDGCIDNFFSKILIL